MKAAGADDSDRERVWGSCYMLTVFLCLVFPFVAPVVAVTLLTASGIPEHVAERWAHGTLKAAALSVVIIALFIVVRFLS